MARLISSWPRRLWTEKYHWCVFDPFFVMSDMVNPMPRILRPVRQGSLYRNYLWPVDNAGLIAACPARVLLLRNTSGSPRLAPSKQFSVSMNVQHPYPMICKRVSLGESCIVCHKVARSTTFFSPRTDHHYSSARRHLLLGTKRFPGVPKAFVLGRKATEGRKSAVQNAHDVWLFAEVVSIDPETLHVCDYWTHQRQSRLSRKATAQLRCKAVGIPTRLLGTLEACCSRCFETSTAHAESGNAEEAVGT
jgi:hypothetical protein